MNQLYRSTAARQPGILSKIGIGTYVDPRLGGGKLNEITQDKEDLSEVVEMKGEEWLFYYSPVVDVAIIRGTFGDESGNLTIEQEALKMEMLEVAMAAKGCGGKVIAQVKQVVANNTMNPKHVVVPGQLVDAVVVVTDDFEVYHRQQNGQGYDPYLTGEAKSPRAAIAQPKDEVTPNDVVCRRAVYELYPGAIINLGIGFGAGTGEAAAIEGIEDKLDFTLELGAFGGVPLSGRRFGVTQNPESYVSPPQMFDFYHGENLDIAVLGAAEIDKDGNVNVSRIDGVPGGAGGFIDIAACAKKVIFCMHFMAKGFKGEVADGKLHILQEGGIRKFVDAVEEISYSGKMAMAAGHEAYFITERCVFQLTPEGIVLLEIAPGMDLEKDVLANMDFKPIVSDTLKEMDARIFIPGRMGCFD